jgi:hypothetical protein
MNVTRTPPNHTAIVRGFSAPASLGSNTLLAAPSTTARIRVVAMDMIASAAVSVQFQSAANNISALQAFAANGGKVLPFNEHGWFETNAGEALNVNLSAANAVGINFSYIVLP